MLNARNHPISQYMSKQSFTVLSDIFRDIYSYRSSGVEPESGMLLQCKEEMEHETGMSDLDLRLVEDAVLFEMARRYYNEGAVM